MTINIPKNGKDTLISDVYPFTAFPTSNEIEINYKSELYSKKEKKKTLEKNCTHYLINLDWLQFVALKIVEVDLATFKSENFVIIEQANKNPNFMNSYAAIKNNVEILELNVNPTNNYHSNNEIVVKIKNNLLYVNNHISTVNAILNELGLVFLQIRRIDIALDGSDILRVMDFLRRSIRNKTILLGNDSLGLDAFKFKKREMSFESYRIGNKKCQKSAIIYVKSDEIKKTKKEYIKEWWQLNGLDIEHGIGRFEIQLNTLHLKKYQITSLEMLMDTSFIGSMFKQEVKDWFKMYQVKLSDIKYHRKDIAIRRGKEIKLFHWDSIPSRTIGITLDDARVDPIINAKRSTTFSIGQLVNYYLNSDTTTGLTLEYITNTTNRFDLTNYAERKLEQEFDKHEQLNKTDRTFIRDEFKRAVGKSNLKKPRSSYSNG